MSNNIISNRENIVSIINHIESGHLLLPEFQRNFTWNMEKTCDLFDSLTKDIFIGSFITARPKFTLSCRNLDLRPRTGEGSRRRIEIQEISAQDFQASSKRVLLDGQQRTTAIIRAIKGIDRIYIIFKETSELSGLSNNVNFEDVITGFSTNSMEGFFSVTVDEIYQCINLNDREIREGCFKTALDRLNSEAATPQYHDPEREEILIDSLLKVKRLFNNLLMNNDIINSYQLDLELDRFCTFFERSNSTGMNLNFIDIITAKIYSGFKLRHAVETFEDSNPSDIDINPSTVESFVRYITYKEFQKVDKKTILERLKAEHFREHWTNICELYTKSHKFLLEEKYLIEIKNLRYKAMFIPLMHFLSLLPSQRFDQMTYIQSSLLRFWFWGSLIELRYGGKPLQSTNDIIENDCALMEKIKDERFDKSLLWQFRFNFDDTFFHSVTSNSAVFYGIMSILNYRNELLNWENGQRLGASNSLEVHHIFPKRYINQVWGGREQAEELDVVDSILNKTIIPKISNIRYKDKAPSEYLGQITERTSRSPQRTRSNLARYLETHAIPDVDGLIGGSLDREFKDFTDKRADKFREILKEHLEDIREKIENDEYDKLN